MERGPTADGGEVVHVLPDDVLTGETDVELVADIWSADALGARCLRVAPGGAVVDEIRAPEGLGTYACMLGGHDGRTLAICAAPDFQEHARRRAREAVLLTVRVDAPHAGLP